MGNDNPELWSDPGQLGVCAPHYLAGAATHPVRNGREPFWPHFLNPVNGEMARGLTWPYFCYFDAERSTDIMRIHFFGSTAMVKRLRNASRARVRSGETSVKGGFSCLTPRTTDSRDCRARRHRGEVEWGAHNAFWCQPCETWILFENHPHTEAEKQQHRESVHAEQAMAISA